MGPRFIAAASGLLGLLLAEASSAQPQVVCVPGKGCSVEVKPPPVQWQPPPVQGQAGGQVGGGGQVPLPTPGPSQWEIEAARRARWEAYFEWRAKIRFEAEAKAKFNARLYIDQMKIEAARTPDPYLSQPAPYFATPGDRRVKFPRVDVGFLGLCFGAYSGPGDPYYFGYCPAIRVRLNRRLGIAFDPAVVSAEYDDLSFGMVGLRPGVEITLVQGKRKLAASHLYAVTGLDVWLPFSEDATPPVFLGGHAGLGAMLSDGRWGIGFEVRGLVRGGLGNQDDPTAHAMSSFRVGFEGRLQVLYVSFW